MKKRANFPSNFQKGMVKVVLSSSQMGKCEVINVEKKPPKPNQKPNTTKPQTFSYK